jgi:allantoin racemase
MPDHVLLINPNTTEAVTQRLALQLQPWCPAGVTLHGVTAPFGEPYIATEAAYALAEQAVLVAFDAHVTAHGMPRAVLVGCFGDPSVRTLRERWPHLPVMGLAEAAMREALAHGPFTVVTGGLAWRTMLERLALSLDLGQPHGLLHVCALEATGGEMAQAPEVAMLAIRQACAQTSLDWPQARAMVLGGAALGGWVEPLAAALAVPLIDNVQSGGRWLAKVLAQGYHHHLNGWG